MWEACEAIRDILIELGPSIDGGKDSLSMAAKVLYSLVSYIGRFLLDNSCYMFR
jgi:hypothetical protein